MPFVVLCYKKLKLAINLIIVLSVVLYLVIHRDFHFTIQNTYHMTHCTCCSHVKGRVFAALANGSVAMFSRSAGGCVKCPV